MPGGCVGGRLGLVRGFHTPAPPWDICAKSKEMIVTGWMGIAAFGLSVALAGPGLAEVPRVMTDIPPVQALVAQVMGDLGTPGLFLQFGGDEHGLQLRPSQMRDLGAADLVIWVGPELTPGLGAALEGAGVAGLALLDDPATARMDYPGGGVNPHAWLDPRVAMTWAGLIEQRLRQLDPEHAAIYEANRVAAELRIAGLARELETRLAPVAERPWIGGHDAYGYFARAFHLTYMGGLAEGDEAPPGAARLSDLAALAEAGGIVCAFPEAGQDPALLAALGPVRLGGPLDPAGSRVVPGKDAYDLALQGMAASLVACLGR